MMNLLKGKLTYLVSLVTVLWAVVGYGIGELELQRAGELILIGLGVFGLRRAIPSD